MVFHVGVENATVHRGRSINILKKWIYGVGLSLVLCISGCLAGRDGSNAVIHDLSRESAPTQTPVREIQDDVNVRQNAAEMEKSPQETGAIAPMPNDCLDASSTVFQAWFKAVMFRTEGTWALYAMRLAEYRGDKILDAIDIFEKLLARPNAFAFDDIYRYQLGRLWRAQAARLNGDGDKNETLKKAYDNFIAVQNHPKSPYFHLAQAASLEIAIALEGDVSAEIEAFLDAYPDYPQKLDFEFEKARIDFERGDRDLGIREMQELAWLYPWAEASKKAAIYMEKHDIAPRERAYDEVYQRVNTLRRMRFWDEAEKAAQEAVQIYPEKYQLLVLYARIPYERSDHAEAARRFEKILEMLGGEVKDNLRPQGVIAYLYRAYAYMGNVEKALDYHAKNAAHIGKKLRPKATMEFALSSGALDVAWENAKIVYRNTASPTELAKFGFIAYLNGHYGFARQKFAEAERGLSGAENRRARYFLAQATFKAAQNADKGIEDTEVASQIEKEQPQKSKKSKRTKKKNEKTKIALPAPTVERAKDLFQAMIKDDSRDYYAILAHSRLAELDREARGDAAPDTPVIQKFEDIAQDPMTPRPWHMEFAYDEKLSLASWPQKVREYRAFIPELERVAFFHDAELYRERNALFRHIAFEIMGVSRMSKRPSTQNLWTSHLTVGGHLVDNRKKETGVWGAKTTREVFELPAKKDVESRQIIAKRQIAIFERGSELRDFVHDILPAFHDYYLARKYAPAIRGVCGSPQNLDDCSTMYPHAYAQAVIQAAKSHRIAPDLIWTLMNIESAFNPDSVSVASAYGLLQIIPVTGYKIAAALHRDAFGPYDLIQPEVSIAMGTWYFAQVLHKFKGYATLSMAGYNGGPHQVARWLTAYAGKMEHDAFIELIPFQEARNYVKKGMARMLIFYRIDAHQPTAFFEIPNTLPDGFETMPNY